jgi:uncharacterized protein with NRDE domain
MCLIVFSYNTVPGYRLVLAGNRDEFYDRPTHNADFWEHHPSILAGKDLIAGGTWLGVNKNGRISFLTNYRKMSSHNPDALSRGHLVKEYLTSNDSAYSYLNKLNSANRYNGFNLFTVDQESFYHFSNINLQISSISPGIHGISNSLLNTPWPKVEKAKNEFQTLIENGNLDEEDLFDLLINKETYPYDQLPETGLDPELEKAVSAIFIQTENYGTRCSTLLFVRDNGDIRFVERVYQPGTARTDQENRFELNVNSE